MPSLPMAAFIGLVMVLSLPEKKAERAQAFDFFGLATFSLGMIGLQMLLDRSERLDWFASAEIWVEAIASLLGSLSLHRARADHQEHFLRTALFRDRNLVLSTDRVVCRWFRAAAHARLDLADAGGVARAIPSIPPAT